MFIFGVLSRLEHEAHWYLADLLYFSMYIPFNYCRRQRIHSSQTKMDNLITFSNFFWLDKCWQRQYISLTVEGIKCLSDNGVWGHVFPLSGCHMLFCGFRLVLERDERRLRGGEKYMNQFLGCPGARKKMTWNNSSSHFFPSINSQLGCDRRQIIRKERRAIKCSHFIREVVVSQREGERKRSKRAGGRGWEGTDHAWRRVWYSKCLNVVNISSHKLSWNRCNGVWWKKALL